MKKIETALRTLFIISILGFVCDVIYVLIDGKLFFASRIINGLVKSFTHFETVLASVLFVWFIRLKINHPLGSEKIVKIFSAFALGAMICLLILNPFTKIIFSIDENNIYRRGPMGEAGFIVAFLFVIYTIVIIIKDNVNRRDYLPFPIVGYVFPFLIGGAVQLFVPNLRLSNVSFVLSIIIVYYNTYTMSKYEDEIPGVYNGVYLSYFFNRTGRMNRMVAYGGVSFKVKDSHGESLIYEIVDAIKNNCHPGTIIIRHKKDAVLVLRENAGILDMENFLGKMAYSLPNDAEKIEIGRGVYFSNSKENEYFLDSLLRNPQSLQNFSMAKN